ncbi:hypothetical protein [Saccharibacillus sacchari]|uniref:hypothetical protein n=1 Tax=Saccharibacillus sacchari TaxID=456493 RepID=UPI0004B6B726|nr:hypothetical protein [Saccharibacillus sacchari]
MNLLEPKDLKQEPEESLGLKRSTSFEESKTNQSPSGAIVLIAGAAAFLLTAALMATVKRIRQTREIKRYFSGETTDRLAASADAIVQLIERESNEAEALSGSGYPASFLLELEREQHRLVEAYGSLYQTLGVKEQSELIDPKQLLIFNGIEAFEALPAAEGRPAAVHHRGLAPEEPQFAAITDGAAQSEVRFIPDIAQASALEHLYAMCLNIRELANVDNRSSYGAERSEQSAARLLASIGQQSEA